MYFVLIFNQIDQIFKMEETVLTDTLVKNIPQIMEIRYIILENVILREMMAHHPRLLHSHRKLPHLQSSNFLD